MIESEMVIACVVGYARAFHEPSLRRHLRLELCEFQLAEDSGLCCPTLMMTDLRDRIAECRRHCRLQALEHY
jgi:hypothetical protein